MALIRLSSDMKRINWREEWTPQCGFYMGITRCHVRGIMAVCCTNRN